MFLPCVALFFQAATSDLLVVDGVALGFRTEQGWVKPQAKSSFTIGLVEVGVGQVGSNHATTRFGPSPDGLVSIAVSPIPEGVYFGGKAWLPEEVHCQLNRAFALNASAQFARNRGVIRPQPYLVNVWESDLDGRGQKEEIVEAVSRGPAEWQAVLLRWRDGSQERVFPLSYSFPQPGRAVSKCRLRAVADFDGDGLSEIVTSSTYANGIQATLWSFKAGKLYPILDASYEVDSLRLAR